MRHNSVSPNTVSPIENLAAVAAVVVLSVVLHAGLVTSSGFFAADQRGALMASGPDRVIAAPESADWGRAVLRLNGMN